MDKKPITRFEFFKEIKEDLKKTAKEFIVPIFEDDVDKVDQIVDDIVGIKWYPIGHIEPEYFNRVKDYYINNKNIVVFIDGDDIKAIQKNCPNCQNLLNWISYEDKFKCFQCENEYYIENEKKEPQLNYFLLRKQDDIWQIGMFETII